MKTMFFGDSAEPLYGAYHPPTTSVRGARAILLCYPGVPEYSSAHWDFRRLAASLSQKGHHVLRFDYYGTGDSAGETTEASVERAIQSTRQAARELLDIAGARTLSVVGYRMGAAVAFEACRDGLKAQDLLLWEPVVHGGEYVSQLERWDRKRLSQLLHFVRSRQRRNELLGYPLPPRLRAELTRLDLTRPASPPSVERVTFVTTRADDALVRLEAALSREGIAQRRVLLSASAANAMSAPSDDAQNSSEAIQAITAHFAGGVS
jgi:pimeloyl-ACP methyl ester carboxylesterase